MKTTIWMLITLCLSFAAPADAQQQVRSNISNYLQLMRTDTNPEKANLIKNIMKLSEADAAKFWPIYREYENELSKQIAERAQFIADYIKYHRDTNASQEAMDASARDLSRRWFVSHRGRLDLLEQYHGKISAALTPLHAGQFLQVENEIALMVEITVAREVPRAGQKLK